MLITFFRQAAVLHLQAKVWKYHLDEGNMKTNWFIMTMYPCLSSGSSLGQMAMVPHHPYYSDHTPCDFFIFTNKTEAQRKEI
jgi:hypothetical protein